ERLGVSTAKYWRRPRPASASCCTHLRPKGISRRSLRQVLGRGTGTRPPTSQVHRRVSVACVTPRLAKVQARPRDPACATKNSRIPTSRPPSATAAHSAQPLLPRPALFGSLPQPQLDE